LLKPDVQSWPPPGVHGVSGQGWVTPPKILHQNGL